jgi:hypothetical protein
VAYRREALLPPLPRFEGEEGKKSSRSPNLSEGVQVATISAFPAWREVLDQIEQALAQSLERAVEPPATLQQPVAPASFEKVDECLARLELCLDRARREATAADAAVDEEIAALQTWLEAARSARHSVTAA